MITFPISKQIDESTFMDNLASVVTSGQLVIPIQMDNADPSSIYLYNFKSHIQMYMPQLVMLLEVDSQSVNPVLNPKQEIMPTIESILDPANIPDEVVILELMQSEEELSKSVFSLKRRKVMIKIVSRRRLKPVKENENFDIINFKE